MNWLIVESGTITNIIEADEEFAQSVGAIKMCPGADIGKPYPTLEQIRADKHKSLDGSCSAAIYAGCNVTPSAARGSKHYSFPEKAQTDLALMIQRIVQGATKFSYKADDESYNVYSAEEITAIYKALGDWITINTAYYEKLQDWVKRETDSIVIIAIRYGSALPDDLAAELTKHLTEVGVDVSALAGLLK